MIKVQRQAENYPYDPKAIDWSKDDKLHIKKIEDEMHRREQAGEIGPVDAMDPHSMTDALTVTNDLYPEGIHHGSSRESSQLLLAVAGLPPSGIGLRLGWFSVA